MADMTGRRVRIIDAHGMAMKREGGGSIALRNPRPDLIGHVGVIVQDGVPPVIRLESGEEITGMACWWEPIEEDAMPQPRLTASIRTHDTCEVAQEAATARATAAEALAGEVLRALREYIEIAHEYGSDLCEFIPDLDGAQAAMEDRTAVYVAAYRKANDVLGRDDAKRILQRGAGLEAGE